MPSSPDPSVGKPGAAVALALLLPVPTLGTAAAMFWWPESTLGKTVFLFGKVWIAVLPLVWHKLVDRASLSWSPPRNGGLGAGIGLGLGIAVCIAFAFLIVRDRGWIDPELIRSRAAKTGLDRLTFYVAGAVYWITLNSLMEEYVWRWFVFRKFETLLGGPLAVIGAAAGFTLHHIVALAGQFELKVAILGASGVFVGGAAWSWLYLRYRSIWPGYLSHAIVDVPIFLIGYGLIFPGTT